MRPETQRFRDALIERVRFTAGIWDAIDEATRVFEAHMQEQEDARRREGLFRRWDGLLRRLAGR